jgi:hypothetical protein
MFCFTSDGKRRPVKMMRTASAVAAAEEAVVNTQPLTTAEKRQLDTMTKGALLDLAEQRGVTVDGSWNKAQIIDALKLTTEAVKGFAGVPKVEESVLTITRVVEALSKLLDTNKHLPPPANTDWSCNAPASEVLKWMIARGLPADLFASGEALVTFLRAPSNAKTLREAQILVAYPPWVGKTLVRLSRAESRTQYARNDV